MQHSRQLLWLGLVVISVAVMMNAFYPAVIDAQGAPKRVPADSHPFDLLTAQYGTGFSDWKSWKVEIDGGTGQVRHLDELDNPASARLSSEQIARLSDEIAKQNFFAIDPHFASHWTDNPTLILTVRAGGKTHEVSVYGPNHLTKQPMVKRFLHVWAAVLTAVPSPNKLDGDTPELWLKAASTNRDDNDL